MYRYYSNPKTTARKPKKWFPRVYSSYEQWRKEWAARVRDGDDNPRWKTIARGVVVHADLSLKEAERFVAGKATAKDLLPLVVPNWGAGTFWFLLGQSGATVKDAESFADSGDSFDSKNFKHDLEDARKGAYDYGDTLMVDINVVLLAERPSDWHPDDNESDHPLMGNSFINTKRWKTVKLKAIRYWTGKKWVNIPVSKVVKL